MTNNSIDQLCINTIRTLSIDAIQKANSGHPGLPLDAAPMAYVLWMRHLKFNPKDPRWADRDRFVLSAGHGSMLLYSLLHLTGYDISLDDLKMFRQWGSKTPGHPERNLNLGIEATTGPLGQGMANAVGMAMAERHLAYQFNRPGHTVVDHHTYALVSDGDMMEGIGSEAVSIAGQQRLGKLIFLYDSNDISLDGPTTLSFSVENVRERYEAYGWGVEIVLNGNTDIDAIDQAITRARLDTSRPSMIIVKTTIGYGSPNKAGSSEAHGSPLGEEEVKLTKEALGWPSDKFFYVPDESLANFRKAIDRGKEEQAKWQAGFDAWKKAFPDLAVQWHQAWNLELPDGWANDIPSWKPGKDVATRSASGKVLNAIAKKAMWVIGGDADLSTSTKTHLDGAEDFDGKSGRGRNIHYGVRENAMGGITNGLAYHGGMMPFCSTFLIFSDYMRPTIRLAAMNHLRLVYVFTHDSIGLGEDGPTHQSIEQLVSLRAIPNLAVIRPCDSNETAEAWKFAVEHADGPVALVLTRQDVPTLDRDRFSGAEQLRKGAYVLYDSPGGEPQAIIIGTGSEVHLALEAQEILAKEGIRTRVVSMPSWLLFEKQGQEYMDSVLPPAIRSRVSVEAGSTIGWHKWVGDKGVAIGVDKFGASAPGVVVMEKYGFTAVNVAEKVKSVVASQAERCIAG